MFFSLNILALFFNNHLDFLSFFLLFFLSFFLFLPFFFPYLLYSIFIAFFHVIFLTNSNMLFKPLFFFWSLTIFDQQNSYITSMLPNSFLTNWDVHFFLYFDHSPPSAQISFVFSLLWYIHLYISYGVYHIFIYDSQCEFQKTLLFISKSKYIFDSMTVSWKQIQA